MYSIRDLYFNQGRSKQRDSVKVRPSAVQKLSQHPESKELRQHPESEWSRQQLKRQRHVIT